MQRNCFPACKHKALRQSTSRPIGSGDAFHGLPVLRAAPRAHKFLQRISHLQLKAFTALMLNSATGPKAAWGLRSSRRQARSSVDSGAGVKALGASCTHRAAQVGNCFRKSCADDRRNNCSNNYQQRIAAGAATVVARASSVLPQEQKVPALRAAGPRAQVQI